MKIQYVAEDGTIFYEEEDCVKYEAERFKCFSKEVWFFDSKGKKLDYSDMGSLEHSYTMCTFMFIMDSAAIDEFLKIFSLEYITPWDNEMCPKVSGLYTYDYKKGIWKFSEEDYVQIIECLLKS